MIELNDEADMNCFRSFRLRQCNDHPLLPSSFKIGKYCEIQFLRRCIKIKQEAESNMNLIFRYHTNRRLLNKRKPMKQLD